MADHNDDKTVIADKTVIVDIPASPSKPAQGAAGQSANMLPVGTRLGEFELIGLVGAGGFGIVYLAEDHSLGRRVALKEYMPAALAQRGEGLRVTLRSERNAETFEAGRRSFVNEARLLAQFDHPALVKVYRFWEDNGTAYMVMPYYEGVTLKRALLERSAPPDEAWLKRLLAPLLDALEVMHAAQVFHRDIAPDNILLLAGERPLLLDFGAARHVISDMTQALTVILKPGYAPVEQYAEMPELKQGAWTDLYALGAVVHLAITGRVPPPAVGRLVNDSLVPLARQAAGRYTTDFLKAIDRTLAVRPEQRPQSVAELRALLHIAEEGATVPVSTAHRAPAVSAPAGAASAAQPSNSAVHAAPHRRTATWGVAAAGAVAALAALAYLLRDEPTPSVTPEMGARTAPAVSERAPSPPTPAADITPPALPTPAPAPAAAPAPPPVAFPAAPEPTVSEAPAPVAADRATPAPPALPEPPSPAAFPPAVAPYSPLAEIERIHRERDPLRSVGIGLANPQVRIGIDRLSFRVRSSAAGYLYVLMLGTDGHFYKLFPNAIDRDNRVRAGASIELPRSGWRMTAGGPPGTNHLIAVVSERPRDFTASGLVEVDPFAEFPPERAAQVAAGHRGSQSPFIGTPSCPDAGQPCSDAYGAASFTIVEVAPDRR